MNRKRGFWIVLWLILFVVTGFLAFGYGSGGKGYGPWHGWGRMGGWDDNPRAGGASGWHGARPGMIGRHGGMMPGMGFGMGGGGYAMMPWGLPDLTPEQAEKIGTLQRDSAAANRNLVQQRWEAQAHLNRLYAAETRDWNAIRAASQTVFDLQRQQLDASIDMQQKIDALLTDRQRQEMTRAWRGHAWMGGLWHP
jgi:Spy/CpxP family protein refolding chaperone